MTAKERLYYLLKNVESGNYDITVFCDLFTTAFYVECDKSTLDDKEIEVFSELAKYTCRFSPFEEDLKIPDMYYGEDVIKNQINIAFNKLQLNK